MTSRAGGRVIAIDFETANERRASACAIGLAWIEHATVLRREARLIRPKEMRFAAMNVSIHGIRPKDVLGAPEFPVIWQDLLPEIEGTLLLAHNASFDMSVLRQTLVEYNLPSPACSFLCTRMVAKAVWPGLHGYGLAPVAAHLKLRFQHHQADTDAEASARVALAAAAQVGVAEIAALAEATGVTLGRLLPDGYVPCRSSKSWLSSTLRPSAVTPVESEFDRDHPLFGKTVVFTGALNAMKRTEAAQLVAKVGGICQDGMRRDTDFLVVGERDYADFVLGQPSAKLVKAQKLQQSGFHVEIIPESEFLRLIG